MKVLHVINGEHYSGAERVQDLLADGLAREGIDCSFALIKSGRFLRSRTSKVASFDFSMGSRLDVWQIQRLARFVESERFEAVHSHTPRAAIVSAAVRGLTGVHHFHHGHSPTDQDSSRKIMNRVNVLAEGFSIRGCSHLFAVSQGVADYFASIGVSQDRVTVIDNGVPARDTIAYTDSFHAGRALRVGMTALFRPRKGLEIALEAVSKVRASGTGIEFVGIGPFESPQYEERMRLLTSSLGLDDAVSWTGFTTDVHARLLDLDVFLFPSLYGEGLPMALIEAMSVGLPTIGSDISGVAGPLGKGCGLLVPPGDADALSRAIKRLSVDAGLRTSLSAAAFERQRSGYSDRSMSSSLATVYRRYLCET
ncbi:glycosyltransferase family 4 protein [Lysobacter niabensis]|uniref:glycosyltransferase family 4 protein n=1 Tax=Agrilutibacter niabensis TaxID=380628 RepID=UPI003611E917